MQHLGYEVVSLSDLGHFPGNARIHAEKQLQASVAELGQYRTIVVRVLEDGSRVILAGNGTADALGARGYTSARVELVECSDAEAVKVNLNDNKISDLARSDAIAEAALLAALDGDYAGLAYAERDIGKALGTEQMPEPGDADVDPDSGTRWGLVIECATEAEQVHWLTELAGQGLNVRAIMN